MRYTFSEQRRSFINIYIYLQTEAPVAFPVVFDEIYILVSGRFFIVIWDVNISFRKSFIGVLPFSMKAMSKKSIHFKKMNGSTN